MRAGHAHPDRRVGLARAQDGAGALHPAGVVDPAGHRGHQVGGGGRWRRRPAGDPVRVGRQRGAPGRASPTRGAGRPLTIRWLPRWPARRRDGRMLLVHRTRRSGLRVAAMVDHEVVEAPEDRELRRSVQDDLARAGVIATCPAGGRVAFTKYVAYGWSRVRSASGPGGPGGGGAVHGPPHRVRGPARRPSAQYLDDFWDRADVEVERRSQSPAGRTFFPVAGASGGGTDREAGHPGQGAHRSWLRRPRLLGYRDVRAAGAHLHPAAGCRRRPRLAPVRHAGRDRAGPPAGARGCRLPVADHPRRGVLGILAGEHGRLPHQRRRGGGGGAATCGPPATRSSAGGSASTSWWPPLVCGCRSGTTIPAPGSASTASPGPTSTAPSPTTTSTPTSWRSGTSGRRPMPWTAFPTGREELGVDGRRVRALAAGGGQDGHPLRRRPRCACRSPRASPATTGGISTP